MLAIVAGGIPATCDGNDHVGVIRNGGTYLSQHLRKNDFWAEGEKQVCGQRIGQGAALLGLEGAVTDAPFEALRANRVWQPTRSSRTTRHTRSTFSRPTPDSFTRNPLCRGGTSRHPQGKRLPSESPIDAKVLRVGRHNRMLPVQFGQANKARVRIVHPLAVANEQRSQGSRLVR